MSGSAFDSASDLPDAPDIRIPATIPLRIALPKGRMAAGVEALLEGAGLPVRSGARAYRPLIGPSPERFVAKRLKARGVVEMIAAGTQDVGFAGADVVAELGAGDDVVELLDTGMDRVSIVAAGPSGAIDDAAGRPRRIRVATEYPELTRAWLDRTGRAADVVRTWGATEVYPPEDADLIVDNTATGATLAANGLRIIDTLMRSSTRLYASRSAMGAGPRRAAIEDLSLLLRSVLEARRRAIVECNISAADLPALIEVLPAMREPTISQLHRGDGLAVRTAVERAAVPELIPAIRARGGTDIVVSQPGQIVP
ncbi:MAG: ATP phosphoribosyltransferase [Phycisphaerales bacterium]